jgi:tetratricopeptide (TPR) repeat protein
MKRIRFALLLIPLFLCVACSRDPKAVRDSYYDNGQKYFKQAKFEEASIEFRNALKIDRTHVPSYLGLARTLQQLNNHSNAVALFRQVLTMDAQNVEAKLELGRYMVASGLQNADYFKQAQGIANDILQTSPKNTEARILLANAYAGVNDLPAAVTELEKALADAPAHITAALTLAAVEFRQKNVERAGKMFRDTAEKHPDSVQAVLSLGAFYMATGRKPQAEAEYRKACDLAPDDENALYALVGFYLSDRRQSDAEAVFKTAIAKKPGAREPRWGLANFHLGTGQAEQGLKDLEEMAKDFPKDRQIDLRLSEAYLNANRTDEAEKHIRVLLDMRKDDAEAHYLMGRLLAARHQDDKALEQYELAIKARESLFAAYLEKARILLNRGDLESGQNTLNEVLARNRNDVAARGMLAKVLAMRGKSEDAMQEAETILQSQPGNEDALAARAQALQALGRTKDAKESWQKLCDLQPKTAAYWYRLGAVEAAGNDSAAATTHFRKALGLQPNLIPAINDLVFMYLKANRYEAALAELDSLAKTSAPPDELHCFRGRIHEAQGKVAEAEKEFNKTIELNPKNYQAYIYLAQLDLRRNNVQQALRQVDQLIARNDRLVPAHLLKGYYHQVANNNAAAIASYRKALELDPENAVAANNLAWLLSEGTASLEEALSLAQKAKKKAPDSVEIADTLGWIYYKMHNYILAIDQLQLSVNNRPKPGAEHYYHLGMAYSAKGDRMLAQQTLRKALELNPTFQGSDEARRALTQKN